MLTEFGFNNAYVSGSHPQMGCRFITQKFSYNIEALASSQNKCKKTKNCKKKKNNKQALKVQREDLRQRSRE
jgi:hypothetical protein